MSKLVILKLDGDLETGFAISLEIGLEGESTYRGFSGRLPAVPKLRQYLNQWQQEYHFLGGDRRIKPQKIIYNGTLNPRKQLNKSTYNLEQEFHKWLASPDFIEVDKKLREELNRHETIRILLCSDRLEIAQLPWYCWDLLENYPQLEIAFGNLDFKRVASTNLVNQTAKVRILAIIGDSQGIDLEADRLFLNSLPNAKVVFLVEPTRQQLQNYLWQETWEIIFFAGHSKTVNSQGVIHLNSEDELTIHELRYGLKKAIAAGLQLAVFNSCDGLGLAYELSQLSLPQGIFMRLPVPDRVAQQFLKSFLTAYAAGQSLYLATRMAREQLQGWEQRFPCASWLPIIYQNPAVTPPSWQSLQGRIQRSPRAVKLDRLNYSKLWLASAIAIICVWLGQSWGWLQSGELHIYDRWMDWRVAEAADRRILVIMVDDRDIQYQQQQGMKLQGSLADDALVQLLAKLEPYQPQAIASDLIHDFPFTPELDKTLATTANFFAICRVKSIPSELISIAPPKLPLTQIGFSNLVQDKDGKIRRQILGMSPDRVCQSDFSLSLRLALNYLNNMSASLINSRLQIGEVILPQLQFDSGGYRLAKQDTQGYQILLNYRATQSPTVSLRSILNGSQNDNLEQLVRDKIILIGGRGHNRDLHSTPLAQEVPGVYLHAQMTSQIISSVLDRRNLVSWLPAWIEFSWLAVWSVVGSVIMLLLSTFYLKAIAVFLALSLLFVSCFIFFLANIWIPALAPALGLLLSALVSNWVKSNSGTRKSNKVISNR